ncbi:MAG TPA: indole-3-glycerol phosphate synthase TrpC [Aggregatilineales bacterium]|nr:indole-3-glycerol phosphate synthase TrpC [Anaerolineales bacterium]HRE48254.1 indole-3-glycerol phosphate synthase TrpC [Aggregatilineales bacterium]
MTLSRLPKTDTILDRIVARKMEEVAQLGEVSLDPAAPPLRDFAAALTRQTVALIAEIKHASPSKGVLIDPFDPVALGRGYAAHGAAAISVLTDQPFFQGSLDDLRAVRAAVTIPLLRKDFTIDRRQITEARNAGADAILLIAAILDDAHLADLYAYTKTLGMAALIEVHNEAEMERILPLNPPLIGINNRDLKTFHIDLAVTERLARLVSPEVILVAESGIFTVEHVRFVAECGARAILVGESLVKAGDLAGQVQVLAGVLR